MDYQKTIKEHDFIFYEAIFPYINEIPDMRPQQTLKKMKQESQNNWRLLCEELEAINHNELHLRILSFINEESSSFSFNNEILEEFIFSYPAITWCLCKIVCSDRMASLLIPHGLCLSFFEMKEDYLVYISSLETAQTFYDLFPNLIITKNIIEALEEPNREQSLIGYIYWLLGSSPSSDIFLINRQHLDVSCPLQPYYPPLYLIIQEGIQHNNLAFIDTLLSSMKMTEEEILDLGCNALMLGKLDIAKNLLERGGSPGNIMVSSLKMSVKKGMMNMISDQSTTPEDISSFMENFYLFIYIIIKKKRLSMELYEKIRF